MKRISSGTVTVCVVAIVVGLVAAFVVKQVLAPKPMPVVEKPKEPTMPVVVAIKNIPASGVIKPGDVRVVQIPTNRTVKEGTLRIAAVAENRIIKEAIKAGQSVREDMLYAIGETLPGLEARIPAGMRAMPIHVDEQSVIAKMVNIGSRVDVAMTVEGDHPDLGEMATKTLLHNVEVIGVDKPTATARRTTSGGSSPATITVAVSPADANLLITAEGTGKLKLSLCGTQESLEHPVSIGGEANMITRRDLLGLAPLAPAPPAPQPYTIERFEGGSMKVITLSQSRVEEAKRATVNSKKFGDSLPVSTENSGVQVNEFTPADPFDIEGAQ